MNIFLLSEGLKNNSKDLTAFD